MELPVVIGNLSKEEKLQLMHATWEDLVKDEAQIESPDWHVAVLCETKERVHSGKERIINWSDAKKEFRRRFE